MVRLASCLVLAVLWTFSAIAGAVALENGRFEAQRKVLEQRVTAKWDALIQRDFAAAYALASPAYRQIYSLEAFKSAFGDKTAWQRVEIVDVAFKDGDAATVGVNLHFVYHQSEPEQAVNMTTYLQEPWVRVDGEWWYLMRE